MKDAKLTPRITETAKALWLIYVGITVTCIFAYWLAGMKLFDAVGHAFSTVAIGGFSTHDDSLAFWNNPTVEAVAIVFMTIAGINFALHFTAWRRASAQPYFLDPELKVYASLLFAFSVLVSFGLYFTGTYDSLASSFRYGTFQVISAMTTTGFTTAPFYQWGGSLPVILILLAFIGGCAGSTAGGMKVIRVILLYRQSVREILRLVHPHAIIPGQDRRPANFRYGDQRGVGFLLPLHRQFRGHDHSADRDRPRCRNRLLDGRRLHHQPGPGSGAGRAQLRRA